MAEPDREKANRPTASEVTIILQQISGAKEVAGEGTLATDRLLELVYDELRRIASHLMTHERSEHILQPTALVHEAYLRLVGDSSLEWKDRAHFMGIAARAMRQILVDHARRRSTEKRGGGFKRITFHENTLIGVNQDIEILELNEAMEKFSSLDQRAARVVEMRVFSGITVNEVAHVLDISVRTVHEDWTMARMWLGRELMGKAP